MTVNITLVVAHLFFPPLAHTAVHCNLSQNGIDHQMCPEDMTSQPEEEEESVDAGSLLLDDDSPSYQDVSPLMYQRRTPPQRSVSESELSRVSGVTRDSFRGNPWCIPNLTIVSILVSLYVCRTLRGMLLEIEQPSSKK